MMRHKTLYPKTDIDKLYVSRKEGGKKLTSIGDIVDTLIRRLEVYIKRTKTDSSDQKQHKDQQNNNNKKTNIKKNGKKSK